MRGILSAIIMAALACLALATASHAQAQSASWTGTWSSQHGDLRLIQIGDRVYGDYAARGYFEARVSENGMRLRGTFQYNSPRTSNGFIEFRRSGNNFTGGWSWAGDGPVSATKINWTGSLRSTAAPQLTYAVGRDEYWADFWNSAGSAARDWTFAGVPSDQEHNFAMEPYGEMRTDYSSRNPAFTSLEGAATGDDPTGAAVSGGPWTGTFTTNHGDIRLIQIGNRVFGDYAARGYFEGCVHNGGQTLRGTFQYLSPRNKHGFIEFRLNGDRFEGQWTWTVAGLPRGTTTINWRGTRRISAAPSLTAADKSGTNFADMWSTIAASQRDWVLGQPGATACATTY